MVRKSIRGIASARVLTLPAMIFLVGALISALRMVIWRFPLFLSFPRKREPRSSVIYPKRSVIWVPACAGMTQVIFSRIPQTVRARSASGGFRSGIRHRRIIFITQCRKAGE
jgi:hypothetical protein